MRQYQAPRLPCFRGLSPSACGSRPHPPPAHPRRAPAPSLKRRVRPPLQPPRQLLPLRPQLLQAGPIARTCGLPRKPLPIGRQHRRIPAGIGCCRFVIGGQSQPPVCPFRPSAARTRHRGDGWPLSVQVRQSDKAHRQENPAQTRAPQRRLQHQPLATARRSDPGRPGTTRRTNDQFSRLTIWHSHRRPLDSPSVRPSRGRQAPVFGTDGAVMICNPAQALGGLSSSSNTARASLS